MNPNIITICLASACLLYGQVAGNESEANDADEDEERIIKTGDFNVFLIDWGKGVSYNQATVNSRVVGAVIAKFISMLTEHAGADPEDVHITEHSLGAHISGYAGERLLTLVASQQGACIPCIDERCGYMGFHAAQSNPPAEVTSVKYFLDTGDSKPFCRFHYQIKVSSANVSDSGTVNGKLMVNLIGSTGQLGEKPLTPEYIKIEPGKNYWFVVTFINDIGTVNNVTVSWLQKKQTPGKIYIDQLEIFSGMSTEIVTSCGENTEIAPNITYYFIPCS